MMAVILVTAYYYIIVKNIKNNVILKDNIWDINTEKDYYKEKK